MTVSLTTSPSPANASPVGAALLPLIAIVLSTYLVIGLALPVLPLYVHNDLCFGAVTVGLIAGSQFVLALLFRLPAGRLADRRGGKQAVVIGLLFATVAGLLYVLSVRATGEPIIAMATLLLGRGLLGAAESFVIAGAMSWGLVLVRQRDPGKVIAWVGTAIYVGFALGAPAGTALYGGHSFATIAFATTVIPVMTLALVARLHAVRPQPSIHPPLTSVLGVVLLPGLGLALTSIGYGAMTTFIALLFAHRGWGQAWLALTVFSGAVIVGRLVLGHLPDRFGGGRVALVCVLVEAAGQVLIWRAPWPLLAFIGSALTGAGYALMFPGFGVEAVLRAPKQSRGVVMSAYGACLDVALGLGSPALGVIASGVSLDAVFLVGAVTALSAIVVALRLVSVPAVP